VAVEEEVTVPIYEYYCPVCDGRFSHLARRFDEPPPLCPGCGSRQAEKLISRVHAGRSEAERRADLSARSRGVDQEDPREMARFLQGAGSLADEVAPVEQELFQEIIARRAEGASDEDLQDVADAVPLPSREEMIRLHNETHHHGHEHEHEGHEHEEHGCGAHEHGSAKKRSPRRARDLGWA
jgi:putative FmdB family regulatory protein